MRFADLEQPIDRACKRLPPPRAPGTLLPRVMAAVQVWARRPWYERAWFTWPPAWQAVSMIALVMVVVGVLMSMSLVSEAGRSAWAVATAGVSDHFSGSLVRVDATLTGARVLWRALVAPVIGYAAAVVILMYLACAAVAVVLNRALFGKVLHS